MAVQIHVEVPLVPARDETVAYIVDPDTGALVDEAFSTDAALSYIAHDGMIAIAVGDARHQDAFDAEREMRLDCWGR